jgi:protein-export membrane protein SecD
MDGNWWFKVGVTALLTLLSAMYLVWTLGGWSTDEEIQAWDARRAQLEAIVQAAPDDAAKAAASKTLDDHLAKAPANEDGTGGGTHADRLRRAPGWARIFPEQKIVLGLDLQGGIDLELQVDLRKAIEASADRASSDLPALLKDEGVEGIVGQRVPGTAHIALFVPPEQVEKARGIIQENTGVYVFLGRQSVDGKDALVYSFVDRYVDDLKVTARDQAVETIRNRIDKFGVSEPHIATKGEDRITVQLPGLDDPQRAIDLVGKTAQLEFRMLYDEAQWPQQRVQRVVEEAVKAAGLPANYTDEQLAKALEGKLPADSKVLHKKKFDELTMQFIREEPYIVKEKVEMTGDRVEYASVARDQFNVPYVRMEMDDDGARIFGKLSGDNVGKRMAIILDNNINSAPVFQEKIPNGVASITLGDASTQEVFQDAQDLVVVLRAGALPAPIEILHNRTVGKTLGDDSVKKGGIAALVAVLLVVGFMWMYYSSAGIVADLAVLLNVLLVMGALAAFGATLTLPGIAGIALTVGMAVDANVIINERIREELREGKGFRAAIGAGYERATWSILDANITTFIAGAVLYSYGSGPIKGFAVTLMIGIVTTVFTGLTVTHMIFDWLVKGRGVQTLSVGLPERKVA